MRIFWVEFVCLMRICVFVGWLNVCVFLFYLFCRVCSFVCFLVRCGRLDFVFLISLLNKFSSFLISF